MNRTEEKMSLTSKLILFAVLAMIIFLMVVMEKESQERDAVNVESVKSSDARLTGGKPSPPIHVVH